MESHPPSPEMFEAIVTAFADTLIRSYRERWNRGGIEPSVKETTVVATASPWLTVDEAAARAQCGKRMLYREVQAGRLRAVKVGGRRTRRFRAEWVDAWLEEHASRV
jgi:excisionase family DNA binding protein